MVAFIFLRMAQTNFPRRDGRRFTPASFLGGSNQFPKKGWPSFHSGILFWWLKLIQNLRLRRCFFCVQLLRSSELGSYLNTKKPRNYVVLNWFGGERGIRTPGPVTVNSFQDYRNRPLCHLSAANVGRENQFCKKMGNLFVNSIVLIN
jgi:phage FluMu protein Com